MKYIFERETVRGSKRKHDGIFGSSCLQFEVELATEALAQGEPPGSIKAATERRVQHELHAAAVVEETLQHQIVLRRHYPEHDLRSRKILNNLFGSGADYADFF